MACVYWIRHIDHADIFSEGYVGVSVNVGRRFADHQKESSGCLHLKNAIQLHGWGQLKTTIVCEASEDYCYEVENKLRPQKYIGWNIQAGGGKPPCNIGRKQPKEEVEARAKLLRGLCRSEESKKKYSESKKGSKNPRYGKPSIMAGKTHTEDSKAKMSRARTGRFIGLESPIAKQVLHKGLLFATVRDLANYLNVSEKQIKRLSMRHPETYHYEYV